jgi:LysM repeat protein
MKFFATTATLLFLAAIFYVDLGAQTLAPSPADRSDALLEALTKKIDEQNAKIDALSQQILKLEQQLSKPGVVIGEATPSPTFSVPSPNNGAGSAASNNTHIVARGETLTSIAKMYKVSVDELQKFNHIENPFKLQVGQTVMIPPSATTPAASPTPSVP